MLVAIEGDFPKENATYFIPRLDIGISDFFQGMIIPDMEGTLSGNLAITFLDARNQEVRLDHPFAIEVQPMGELPGVPLPGEEQPGGAPWLLLALGGAAAAALVTAAVFMLKKVKAKRRDSFINE